MKIKNIFVVETYFDSEKNKNLFVKNFEKYTSGQKDKYFCNYSDNNSYFLRIGFINPSKKFISKFIKLKSKGLVEVKSWYEHPNTKEWDMELMKFLAYSTYELIQKHFKNNKNYYEKSKMRYRDNWGRKNKKENKPKMSENDWKHYIHHIFNMMGYGYNKEVYLHSVMVAGLHYNMHYE
jgi:hypothetical protein